MTRTILLKVANYLLFITTCALVGSGLLLEFRFEGGGPQKLLVAGVSKHDWSEIHFVIALVFVGLCVLHLLLNWGWIVKVAAQQRLVMLCTSVGFGLLFIALPFLLPVTARHPGDGAGTGGAGVGPQLHSRQHRTDTP